MNDDAVSEVRRAAFSRLMEQILRTDPEFRAEYATASAGGIGGFAFADEQWPAVTEALRALLDNAGRQAIGWALAPYLRGTPGDRAV